MNKIIREIPKLALLSALLFLSACNNNSKELENPNILWIYLEDTSPLLNCYGTSNISTPNIDKLAVMGFVEVISHLGFFRKLIERVLSKIEKERPNQIILIDYPGFNLRLAKKIKSKFDIPITYTIVLQMGKSPTFD